MIFVNEDYLRKMNEVDVNGQPVDQNADQDGGADYTVNDMQPVSPTGNDGGDDTGAQDTGDNPPADDQGEDTGDNTEDFTQDDGGDGDQGSGDDGGDPEDFTGGDEGDGGDMGDGGDGGEGGGDDGGSADGGGDGSVQADDNRGMESEIFKDLTQDQIDIKHQELKTNFGKIYDTTSSLIDRLNDIPTNDTYMASINFVSNQLADLRQMVTDYMNNVYSTKSYMENSINYNKFLMTLKGINDILEEIYKELGKEEPK